MRSLTIAMLPRDKRRPEIREVRFEYLRIEQGSRPLPWGDHTHWSPAVDVFGNDEIVVAEVHLPGVLPEEVQIELTSSNTLRVSGQRRDAAFGGRKQYYHMEIERGSFQRLIQLPDSVDTRNPEVTFEHGVLRITLGWRNEPWAGAHHSRRFPEEWS